MRLNFFSPPWCEQLTPFFLHRDPIPMWQLLAKFGPDWTHPRVPGSDLLPSKHYFGRFLCPNGPKTAVLGCFWDYAVPYRPLSASRALLRVWACKLYMLLRSNGSQVPREPILRPFWAALGPRRPVGRRGPRKPKTRDNFGWVAQNPKTRAHFPHATPHFEWFPTLRMAPTHAYTPKPLPAAPWGALRRIPFSL